MKVCHWIKYIKLTANDSKSYVGCLNKLEDQYDNIYHHSIGKKPVKCWLFCFD